MIGAQEEITKDDAYRFLEKLKENIGLERIGLSTFPCG